jgi:transcriptional regulator with AAA-type ATPase domain/tetratricopeptide (TPR) repeat protein
MTGLERVLGDSAAMAAVRAQAARVARSSASGARRLPPILILGETGTGKGLLAGALHAASARAAGPFVDVNCAAIPETLLEAELFGFERGAFTDARQAKPGLFQAAAGGTIFLDEVGLMPAALQAKLLKVIEERAVRRLGSTRSEPVDAAVVAATSEDLAAAVREGRFRADLYHRLAVVTFVLPPLRARERDVLVLADDFLARVCEDYGLPPRGLSDGARAALLAHSWPGNVRELANVLERAALLSDEPVLTAERLGLPTASPAPAEPRAAIAGGDAEAESERQVLLDVLRATEWNFTRAAARLGLPRNTLRYRAERLGLTPDAPPERRRGGRPRAAGRPAPPAESPVAATVEAASSGSPRPSRRVTLLRLRQASPGWERGRALEESAAKVRSFGGRIEEIGADDLLASFGLEPDEDAPRRAAYAALAAVTQAARHAQADGPAAVMTAALHTDSVAVVREGEVMRVDPDARDVAQRPLQALLAAARPGSVVATAAAGRFLARRFELAPLAGEPAGACRVVRHAEAGRTPFVGRERELRLLEQCLELAEAGQGQLVLVVGEPGIGKSRLVHEFRRRLGRRAAWVEGHALSFGRAMPFHPVIDMVRRTARIDDADAEGVAVDKLGAFVRRLGAAEGEALPFLRYLLSFDPGDPAVVTMDPRQRHTAIVQATHALLERAAAERPHVVVIEDVHWCDPATEDWTGRLAERIATSRTLLLLTCRPGYRPPGGNRTHTAIALATLSGEDSLRVAGGLLGARELPAALQALVIGKAEGNPFFIEELVRALEEQGAVRRQDERVVLTASLEGVAVPDTVEEVLLSRIHRLDERGRHVLEVASVIGRHVPFPLLRAVTARPEEALATDLRRLRAAEFLYEGRVYPEVEHVFKHALTEDVVYEGVKPQERRALHARTVRALEELYRERLDEHVERLAYHALHGELWAEAVRYARQAGGKAFDRSANREAVASFDQALAALAHLPQDPARLAEAVDIRLAVRSALLQLAELPRIARYLREAEALASALGDRRRLAWVWTYMTITHLFDGDPARALAVGERALAQAEEVGDVGLRASARTPLAHACRELGDFPRALTLFREAIAALSGDLVRERLGQAMPPSFYARSMAAFCLAEVGDFAEARRLAGEAMSQTLALDLPFGLALAHTAEGHTCLVQGRLEEAAATLAVALEVIEVRGLPTWFPWAAALRGYALALAGRLDEGQALLERALERATALPFLFGHSQWVGWLAHTRLLAGRLDEAASLAEESLALARRRGERGYEAWALHIRGEVEARRGPEHRAAARALHRQSLALAEALGMRPLADRCRAGLDQP